MNSSESSNNALAAEGKYLTFKLDGEGYGVNILKVKEIIGIMPVTPVPNTPQSVLGVINLRGKVIPIVDLRGKFGLPEVEADSHSCIMVVECRQEGGETHMGVVVDAVNDVRHIRAQEIEQPPDFGGNSESTKFIIGMAKCADGVNILIDIENVLGADGFSGISQAA